MNAGRKAVLFVGQSYYHAWYLSRALRRLGWKADVLNWDTSRDSEAYYHGEDFRFEYRGWGDRARHLKFYLRAARTYDVFHFSNAHCMAFGAYLQRDVNRLGRPGEDVRMLKRLGKRIVYSQNGCLDGVTQTSFASWGERPVCDECPWQSRPDMCSDERNAAWGRLRNELADFQCVTMGNRKDFNLAPTVHEVPEFYCMDPDFWSPDLRVPTNLRLAISEETVKIYHAVGNYESRTDPRTGRNLKSTHIYVPLVEKLKKQGENVELIFFHGVPSKQIRFYQAQADIVVDMLTFGWFGANVREALMMGKPCVCFLRPEWLETMRKEIPGYAEELPVVNATPDTVEDVLRELVRDPERRRELGRRGREFALKWHSAEAGARRMAAIYSELLGISSAAIA